MMERSVGRKLLVTFLIKVCNFVGWGVSDELLCGRVSERLCVLSPRTILTSFACVALEHKNRREKIAITKEI